MDICYKSLLPRILMNDEDIFRICGFHLKIIKCCQFNQDKTTNNNITNM